MMTIYLFICLILNNPNECEGIVGKWQSVIVTEDRQRIDSCLNKIKDIQTNLLADKIISFEKNGTYSYHFELNNFQYLYSRNSTCDSIAIYSSDKQDYKTFYRTKFSLIDNNILLLETLGRHGIISELLIRLNEKK